MTEIADVIVRSGRAGIELALFVILPVMIVMLSIMRLLEAKGVLDHIIRWIAPVLKPLGLPGLGVFAMVQVLFIGAFAPVATLAMMDAQGTARRYIAATLAVVLALPQANVSLPMGAKGLALGPLFGIAVVCALIGGAATYYLFARNLPIRDEPDDAMTPPHKSAEGAKGLLDIIQRAGAEAFKITIGAMPMLVLALVVVNGLKSTGAMGLLEGLLAPVLSLAHVPAEFTLAILTKYLAGGTAMMGVSVDALESGLFSIQEFNALAGFLVHPFDLPGVAILLAAGSRVAGVARPAMYGAALAVLLRSMFHVILF